jgi:hypothetical protein
MATPSEENPLLPLIHPLISPRASEAPCKICHFIQLELITKGAGHLGPFLAQVSEDDTTLDEAIATLGTYSLIRRNPSDQTLSIHRLVQAVLRDTMDEPTRKLWTERAVQAVNEVLM